MTACSIRPATSADVDGILAMFPRLANFDLPAHRAPEDAWRGDRAIVEDWARGNRPDVRVSLACDDDGAVLGCTVVTLRPEALSHEPSAHLEVLVVAAGAEGRGVGGTLLADAERQALNAGARSMTLAVFAANTRARALYERRGFDGEIVRYFKRLSDGDAEA